MIVRFMWGKSKRLNRNSQDYRYKSFPQTQLFYFYRRKKKSYKVRRHLMCINDFFRSRWMDFWNFLIHQNITHIHWCSRSRIGLGVPIPLSLASSSQNAELEEFIKQISISGFLVYFLGECKFFPFLKNDSCFKFALIIQ